MTSDKPVRLILVCGLPGSGKTTLAKHLAQELLALRLCEDEWMAHIGIDLHDEDARDRMERLFWQFTQDLLRMGQSVILESGFWLRSDRDEKRVGARKIGALVELHVLDVPFEERWHRIEKRNSEATFGSTPIFKDQLSNWDQYFQTPSNEEISLFDVGETTRSDIGRHYA